MLKARGVTGEGEPLFIFGLSHENLQRLQAGETIHFTLRDMGFSSGEVMIISGPTEAAIARQLGVPLVPKPVVDPTRASNDPA